MSDGVGRRVLVTGAAGFVGRRLVAELASRGHSVRGLVREAGDEGPAAWTEGALSRVEGDLLRPEAWSPALEGCEVVVHLAARTGKAAPAEYAAVNVDGTRGLLEAARAAGVDRFLFVSSIAARFPAKPDYPYARSKAAAERVVAAAGLRWTIARPTIVVGPGSGPLRGLETLARLPVVPLLGGGRASIQPVWVDDLVSLLVRVLENDRFEGEILELGGPEILPIGDLLRRLRQRRGAAARFVGLPAAPFLAALTLAERVARPLLPVTAGQLASFVHDSSIETNTLFDEARAGLLSVDQMLEASAVASAA